MDPNRELTESQAIEIINKEDVTIPMADKWNHLGDYHGRTINVGLRNGAVVTLNKGYYTPETLQKLFEGTAEKIFNQ